MLVDGINIIKKPFIDVLIEKILDFEEIDGVILFGSVLTENCTEESDIDMFFVTKADIGAWEYNTKLTALMDSCHDVVETDVDLLTIKSFDEFYTKQNILLDNIRQTQSFKIIFDRGDISG